MANILKSRKRISTAILEELLHYNPEAGALYWKERYENKKFNSRFAHKEAGTIAVVNKSGYSYRLLTILGKTYYAHHIIFALTHGFFPADIKMMIDHEDGDSLNNKLSNLRLATHRQNLFNRKINKNNKTKVKGVYQDKRSQRYIAFLSHKYLGSFASLVEAQDRREQVAKYCHKEFYRDR